MLQRIKCVQNQLIDCVIFTFKRVPEDDPNTNRNMLEQNVVM
jgi:hypothetical protein